jgi:hypothetical protein
MGVDFHRSLREMRGVFDLLDACVPAPVKVPRDRSFVFRYAEQSLEQALVMKLARAISDLGASVVLLEKGYVQEVGTLERGVDDFDEEIQFLGLAKLTGTRSEVHDRFLAAVYMEVIEDREDVLGSLTKKRPGVTRREIREAIDVSLAEMARQSGTPLKSATELTRAVSTLYNSFAHAGSPQVLEMYGGNPPHYHLDGMLGTPRIAEHERDLRNHFYRVSLSLGLVAMVVGSQEGHSRARQLSSSLERVAEAE